MPADPAPQARIPPGFLRRHVSGLRRNPGIRMVRDLAVLSLGQIGSQVLGFAVFAHLARALGPTGYGALEYVLALAAFGALVIDFGLGAVAVRSHAGDPAALPRLAALLPLVRALLALVTIPCLLGAVALASAGLGEAEAERLRLLALLYGASLLPHVFRQEWLLQGLERMDLAALAQMLRIAVFAALVFLLVRGPGDLLLVGAAEIVSVLVWTGFYLRVQVRAGLGLGSGLRGAGGEIRRLLRAAAPLGANAVLWGFVLYVPPALLAALAGLEEAAWFGAGLRLATALLAFTYLYHFNLYPAFARRLAEGPEALVALASASMRIVAWGLIGPALVAAVHAGAIMALLFGPPFAAAGPALAILIWGVPVHFLSGHARWALTAAGRGGDVLVSAIAGAAACLLAGPPLILAFGAAGAAGSVTLAILAIWAGAELRARARGIGLPGLGLVAPPLATAGLAAGLAALALPGNPPAAAAAALALYGVAGLLLDRRIPADLRRLAYAKRDAGGRGGA